MLFFFIPVSLERGLVTRFQERKTLSKLTVERQALLCITGRIALEYIGHDVVKHENVHPFYPLTQHLDICAKETI